MKNKFTKIETALKTALNELPPDGKPDALLFLEWEDDCCDYDIPERVCGLPVFHHGRLRNQIYIDRTADVPWVPIWKNRKKQPSLEYLEYFNEVIEEVYNEFPSC